MTTIKIIAAIGVLSIIASCGSDDIKRKKEVKPEKNEGLIIGDPLQCGLDSLTIFPVGCSYKPEVIEAKKEEIDQNQHLRLSNLSFTMNSVSPGSVQFDSNASIEYINEDNDSYDIRNLLFYNVNSGESYALVDDSVHILSFAIHKEFESPMIIYRVVKEDYNKDEKYDGFDPVMLYVSALNGKGFKAVTPADEYFIDYTLKKETNSILIKTAIDSNKDLQFLKDDETNFRSMKLDDPKMSENIFDESIKDILRKFN